jgi:H+/gluconate symporter-like permease
MKGGLMVRRFAWIAVILSVMICVASFGIADAFESKYYNKVPYKNLFQPNPKQMKVQRSEGGQVVQAVIPVEQEEEQVEPQTIKPKGD